MGIKLYNLGKLEDTQAQDGDEGLVPLAVRKDTAAALADADGDYCPLIVDSSGRLHVAVGGTVTSGAPTSGGWDYFNSIDLDESEEEVKGSAGVLGFIFVVNLSDAVKYLKVYDAAAADVTVGTTATVMDLPIPTQGDTNGAGFYIPMGDIGTGFDNGITVAATTGIGDADSGAPGANEIIILVGYK